MGSEMCIRDRDNGGVVSVWVLQWREAGGSWSSSREQRVTTPLFRLSGLDVSKSWEARVRGENLAGSGAWSATATVAAADMLAGVPQIITPARTTAVTVHGYSRAIVRLTNNASIGYQIRLDPAATATALGHSPGNQLWSVAGLSDGTIIGWTLSLIHI